MTMMMTMMIIMTMMMMMMMMMTMTTTMMMVMVMMMPPVCWWCEHHYTTESRARNRHHPTAYADSLAHLIRNVYEKAEGGRKRDAAYPVRMTLFGLSAGVYWVKVPEALSECQRDKPTIYLSAVRTSNAVVLVSRMRRTRAASQSTFSVSA
eukprot:745043-Rhodomonas_salina.1